MDVKEAVTTVAPHGKALCPITMPSVWSWARGHCCPTLANVMISATVNDKHCIVRELRPLDMRFELSGLTQDQATKTARSMAGVIGWAHGRQMEEADRRSWGKELRDRQAKSLGAPRGPWNGVLELTRCMRQLIWNTAGAMPWVGLVAINDGQPVWSLR